MLGFNEQEEAEGAYFANYDKDWPKKHKTVVTAVNLEDFEKWIQSSHRKTKAFAEYKSLKSVDGQNSGQKERSSSNKKKSEPNPIVESGTIFKNNEAGGDAVAVVVGSEVKNGERSYMVSFAPDKESAEAKLFFGDKWLSESELQQRLDDGRFAEYKSVKYQNQFLNDGEVFGIIKAMKDNATVIPFIEIKDSNWRDRINTPIGPVKMGENQRAKLFNKGREQQYGMLVESLYNPDIILEEKDKETDMFHERPFSYLFIRTFVKDDGKKFVHFESVTVSQKGLEVSISSHIIRENQLKNKLKSDRLLYKATALDKSANSSAEQPTNTGGSLSSENKDSKSAAEKQEGIGKRAFFNLKPVSDEGKKQLDDAEREDRIKELFEKEKEKFANESGHNSYAEGLRESDTWQEAVSFFRKKKSELEAEAKDWSGRKYKKNGGSVLVRSDEDMDGWEEKSVDGINERRRRNAIRGALERAQEYEEFAQTLMKRVGVTDVDLNKDSKEYKYQMTIRPFSIGTQPDGHLRHEDDGSPYGVVVYDHPLTRQEAENFSLTPLTEAKELEGKNFEVPFGKGVLKYQVRSVDENGRVKFLINGEHERSLSYYRFLDEIGDKAKEVAEGANRDAAEKQDAGEKTSAEIEAAWKKRIDGYIKEHYPAISERSENGMAQRIASYKDKVLTEMRDNAELEITAMKEEEGVFGERVPVVSGEFPKGLPEHKVITKKQKGGKSTVAENVYVAMVNGDLYVKRYVRGGDLKNISVRIPGAKKYDFNEIKYRLDLGIGTSTDAVRLMGDAIDELYKRGDFQESIFEKAERIAREAEEKKGKQAKSARETHHEVHPISTSPRWGKVYQWGIGSFKDAVDFLMNKKDGMLKGVFYRDEIGEIGVGWGVAPNDFNGRGLSHIVRKHVNKLHDFSDVDEMIRVVEDVISHGVVRKDKDDSYAIENDTYRVVVVKDEDGAWVLSAFDYVNSKKEKAKRKDTAALGTPGQSNVEAGAVTSNLSENKDNKLDSEKQVLNENAIRESPFSEITKDGAMAYINGNINFATSVAYQQIYNYVRDRSENNQSNSTGRSAAQHIAAVDEASGGRGGLNGVQTGRMAGETDQPGGSQNSKRVGILSDGAGSDTAVRGEMSADGGLPSGDTGRKGGSRTGSKGDNVRKPESERGSSGTVGEPVEEGRDSSNRGNIESCKDELKALLLEYEKASKKGLSLSVIGMNAEQIEIAGKILVAGVKLGYAYLKAGIIKFEHWNKAMHNDLALPFATSMHLSNAEIDEFIGDMWEYPYTVDGETRLLREWASIIGKAELRKKVGASLEEKRKAQEAAEPVAVKVGDRDNIAETLPFLLPQQQEDVLKAETQFFDESHNDREHAFGKGYMFTNGTGTGKTYTGLGIVKRFIKQGKGRVLVLTPSQTKVKDWVKDAKNLGIELNDLDAVAKAKKDGTTATTEKGEGAVITTYANFRQNKALLEDLFDLIVYDESHRLLENKDGIGTAGSLQHYKLSNRNENYSFLRLQEINPVWNDYQAKIEEFDAERGKLIERLKKEYGIANELVLGQRGELPPALNGNWTGEMERKFPKLAQLQNEVKALNAEYEKQVKPELERQAKKDTKHTKVVFLSATPFNTRENLDYAEGYIFSYPENDRQVGHANQSPRSQFYLEHFGAGYRWRYNRLESHTDNAEAVSKQEVEFSDYLQHTLQTMSGRIIDSPYDYSRDFPTVTMEKADAFNAAMEKLSTDEATCGAYRD